MAMDNATRMARKELMDEAKGFVELGGKQWKLQYGFRQITEFERLSGVSVLHVAAMMIALKSDTIVKGLWVCMRQQKPKLTEAKICDWLDQDRNAIKVCLKEFIAAIIKALPDEEEEEEDEDAGAPLSRPAASESVAAGTGTPS